jgi:uncharacterized ferredoxin-like protein
MLMRLAPALAVLALAAALVFCPTARAADCSQGSDQEKIACLDGAVKELTAKMETLTKDLAETLKWNDRVAIRNEDMRIFPRCLDNPGPNSQNITDVFANSCAKVSAQTWMLAKPYH